METKTLKIIFCQADGSRVALAGDALHLGKRLDEFQKYAKLFMVAFPEAVVEEKEGKNKIAGRGMDSMLQNPP